MNIHGFTKTTLLDYPGLVAATIFTGGCNFRCPFCHNFELVLNPGVFPAIDDYEVLNFLQKRFGVLKGVCITGGEPTLDPDLKTFIERIKNIGYKVKLDTNGYNPAVLKELIDSKLLDYVAMDIKAGRNNYSLATGLTNLDISKIDNSIDILRDSNIEYEFRTTVVKNLHSENDFLDIASWLPKDCNYFIQSYKETVGIGTLNCESFSKPELESFLGIVKSNLPKASLRGID